MKENESDYDNYYNGTSVQSSFKISNKDKFQIYSECLSAIFDKMYKVLSKSNPYYEQLYNFLKNYKTELEQDKNDFKDLNADKYFQYMKMSLDGDNNKIAEIFLEKLLILIKENLLTGESDEIEINNEKETKLKKIPEKHHNKFNLKPKVINSIISSISKFLSINDKIICLNSINLLQLILLTSKTGIHDQSLGQILSFYFWIFGSSTTTILIDSSKKALLEIVRLKFKEMEHSAENLIKQSDDDFSDKASSTDIDTMFSSEINEFESSLFNSQFCSIYKTPIDKMLIKKVRCLVDSICIYYEKNKRGIKSGLNNIPQNSKEIITNPNYNQISRVNITNEKDIKSGYFGWCYICRNAADHYDIDTRLPICSLKCKKEIRAENIKIFKFLNGELINEDDIAIFNFNDCRNIFINLCKMVSSSPSKNQNFNSKVKILALEALIEVIEQNGKFLSTKKDFSKIIKENLIENLLATSLSDDPEIFKLSISLFFKLWLYFREHLKQEISVFNETVFLKILDSENSSYEHKLCILENFQIQAETPQYYVELYANYDCDRNENFLVNRIVTALGKIGQGKYLKGEHSLTPIQENTLKTKALKTLTLLVNSLLNYSFDQLQKNNDALFDNDKYDDIYLVEEINSYNENITIEANKEKSIDENLKYKSTLEKAVEKFNIKYKNGINFLKKVGFIHKTDKEQEAKDIANFLRNNQALKKEYIGDILGDNTEINLKVLKYYTDSFQFHKKPFLESLRYYLSTFQIPGESQKIERIVDAFATKYNKDNPKFFKHQDCGFYLAFTILLIQTELHNPNVKEKMGIEGFISMLSNQESTKTLSHEYLTEIYEDILKNPISLPEIEKQKELLQTNKEDQIKLESRRLLNEVKEKLQHGKGKQYLVICEFEYVSPLMSSIWSALLAVFSVILEETDDENLYSLCLDGMAQTICILSILGLDFEKETIIKGLCKITNLSQSKEIKIKNIACIKKIFELGLKDGNPYFKYSWKSVLEVISKIDFFLGINIQSKVEKENYFSEFKIKRKSSNNIDREILFEKNNIDIISKTFIAEDYDKIFNKTEKFNDSSIIDFIGALCEMAIEEIRDQERIFSLQKLIEVAEINMTRKTDIWKEIWRKSSEAFLLISLNPKKEISEKGINYLRNLAIKYLEKDHDTNFQSELLKSFKKLLIQFDNSKMQNIDENTYKTNKEYSVECVVNLVESEGKKLKEKGWEMILEIVRLLSNDLNEEILVKVFKLLKKIIDDYPKETKNMLSDITKTLIHFSYSFPENVIDLLTKTIQKISKKKDFISSLKDYCELVKDKRENIYPIALKEMFELVNKKIESKVFKIDEAFYNELTQQILIPLSNFLQSTQSGKVLKLLIEQILSLMINQKIFMKTNFVNLLQVVKTMSIDHEEVMATTGINCLGLLIDQHNFDIIPNYSSLLLSSITEIFQSTLQKEFFTLDAREISIQTNKTKYRTLISRNIIYSIVQHNLINHTKTFLTWFVNKLNDTEIKTLLTCLKSSYEIGLQFNLNFDLRNAISANYIDECTSCLGIFNQQEKSISEYFELLLYCIKNAKTKAVTKYKEELIESSIKLMKIFVEQLEDYNSEAEEDETVTGEEEEDEINKEKAKVFYKLSCSMEKDILPALEIIEYYKEGKYREEIYKLLVKCIICNSHNLRVKLQDVLLPALLYKNK